MHRIFLSFLSFLLLLKADASECVQTEIGSTKLVFSQLGNSDRIVEGFAKSFSEEFYFLFQRENGLNCSMRNAIAVHPQRELGQSSCISELIAEIAFKGFWLGSEYPTRVHCLVNQDQSGVPLTSAFSLTRKRFLDEGLLLDQTLLTDWQMAASTIAGAIIDDCTTGNRFICPIRPGQATSFTVLHDGTFLDDRNVPTISFFSPIDSKGEQSVGSWKGKALAVRNSGLISGKVPELDEIPKISINTKRVRDDFWAEYDNGMKVCDLPSSFSSIFLSGKALYRDHHNLSVLDYSKAELSQEALKIADYLGVEGDCVGVLQVIKRDKGFHQLSSLIGELDERAVFVILNRSKLPEGYGYFVISEDLSYRGLPLIQLYRLEPSQALVLSKVEMNHLALTPCEEFLFRETETIAQLNNHLKPRIHSEILIFIYR